MKTLVSLPAELREQITLCLEQTDLSRLSRTCKSVRKATLPFLLRRATFKTNEIGSSNAVSSFLRNLNKDRAIADLVEELHFTCYDEYAKFINGRSEWPSFLEKRGIMRHYFRPSKLEREPFEQALANLSVSETEQKEWESLYSSRPIDVFIAFVFLNTRKIRRLHLSISILCNNQPLELSIHHLLSSQQRVEEYSKLWEVVLGNDAFMPKDSDSLFFNIHIPLAMLYFPAIEALTTCLPCFDLQPCPTKDLYKERHDSEDECRSPSWKPGNMIKDPWVYHAAHNIALPVAKNLKKLDITWTFAGPAFIGKILTQTPNLTDLQYNFFGEGSKRYGSFDCADMQHALEPVRDTLRHLTISINPRYNGDVPIDLHPFPWVTGSLGSLSSLTSLRSLKVSPTVLFGRPDENAVSDLGDVLPPSLEELCLTDELHKVMPDYSWWYDGDCDGEEIMEKFGEFVESGNNTSFKKLTLELLDAEPGGFSEETHQDIKDKCERHGIIYEIKEFKAAGSDIEIMPTESGDIGDGD